MLSSEGNFAVCLNLHRSCQELIGTAMKWLSWGWAVLVEGNSFLTIFVLQLMVGESYFLKLRVDVESHKNSIVVTSPRRIKFSIANAVAEQKKLLQNAFLCEMFFK